MNIGRIYIIIVNYKGEEDTIECLESLLRVNYYDFQVIIIDNSEGEGSLKVLVDWAEGKYYNIKTHFPELVYPLIDKPIGYKCITEPNLYKEEYFDKILFVKANENRGFSAANNVGLRYVLKYAVVNDFVWLLNNDTVVKPDILQEFSQYAVDIKPKIGMIGGNLYYYNTPSELQGYGGCYNSWIGVSNHLKKKLTLEMQYSLFFKKANYIIGASMFIPLNFLKDVGLMSEDYFLYYEEIDWAERGRKKGWRIDYCSTCDVYHKEGGSTKNSGKIRPEKIDLLLVRSKLLLTNKFFSKKLVIIYLFILLVTIPRRLLRGQLNLSYKMVKQILKM